MPGLFLFDRNEGNNSFLVPVLHVAAAVAHGLDDLVERDAMLVLAAHGHALGVDRLDRAHRVAFDARDLDEAVDQTTGKQPGHANNRKTKEPSRQSARCRQGAGDGRGCGKDRERRHGGENPRIVSSVPHLRPPPTPTRVASDCWQARSGRLSSHQQLGTTKALEPGLSDGRGLLDQ